MIANLTAKDGVFGKTTLPSQKNIGGGALKEKHQVEEQDQTEITVPSNQAKMVSILDYNKYSRLSMF